MAYKITDACLSCGACIDECPTDATYVIDEDKCIDCGACAGACPVGACEEA